MIMTIGCIWKILYSEGALKIIIAIRNLKVINFKSYINQFQDLDYQHINITCTSHYGLQ